jgi:hypothetical protein
MLAYAYSPSIQEAERSQVWGHPKLHGEILPQEKQGEARSQWLTPEILATQEAEIRTIEVQSQPGK